MSDKSKINKDIFKKSLKTGFYVATGVYLINIYLNYAENPNNFRIQDNYKALIFFIIMPLSFYIFEYIELWLSKRKKNE